MVDVEPLATVGTFDVSAGGDVRLSWQTGAAVGALITTARLLRGIGLYTEFALDVVQVFEHRFEPVLLSDRPTDDTQPCQHESASDEAEEQAEKQGHRPEARVRLRPDPAQHEQSDSERNDPHQLFNFHAVASFANSGPASGDPQEFNHKCTQ